MGGGILVFDKIKFQKFVTNKEFLADSYTAFNNKIGLTANGQYLTKSNEVVLDFPYKDCVLQGGQTKEKKQERQEVFWNQTLAPDEIDRLEEPKVFTNWKRYDKDGEHKVKKVSFDDHLIIKGNNLIALHSIKKVYGGKIKLIYIDPPYNTRSKADTFLYNNTFKRSTWLTFMKNRLEVSKELLRDDGVICIAIDDHEYAHLKILCDEIFDKENYIGTTVIRHHAGGRSDAKFFSTVHEYCLFYAKRIESAKMYNLDLTDKQIKAFNEKDVNGRYKWRPFIPGGSKTLKSHQKAEYSIYYSKSKKSIIAVGGERTNDISFPYKPRHILTLGKEDTIVENNPEDFSKIHNHDIVEILPTDRNGNRSVWGWSDKKKFFEYVQNGDFDVRQKKDGKYIVKYRDRIKKGFKPQTIWYDGRYDAGSNGTKPLKKEFNGEKVFSYPKSIYTVMDTIKIFSKPDSNDIILDFFAGSGTTGYAVLELDKEENGNRKFILCEQMDYIDTLTSKRIQQLIGKNQSGSFIYCELAEHTKIYQRKIFDADDSTANALWDELRNSVHVSYRIDFQKVSTEEFQELILDEKKGVLTGLLDKNMLYIPYSERNNCDYEIKEIDKKLTEQFYNQ